MTLFKVGTELPVLDVFQINPHEFHGFGLHIKNEISAQEPDAVLSIKGHFLVASGDIWIDNERLGVNDEFLPRGSTTHIKE